MAVITDIKRASERRLLAITPSVATSFEAIEFNPPVDLMYQRCQFMILPPDDPAFPPGYYRERVQMQVFVADTKGHGTTAANERAELIRSTFFKGLSYTENSIHIRVLETPQIQSAFISQDRVIVPVMIDLTCDVYS